MVGNSSMQQPGCPFMPLEHRGHQLRCVRLREAVRLQGTQPAAAWLPLHAPGAQGA